MRNPFLRKVSTKSNPESSSIEIQKTINALDREAEVLALQNQINPHFLYNVLDSIRGEALKAGAENIADITEALSTYFRYTISETNSLVPLIDEIENVKNYFKIQHYRFGDRIQLKFHINSDEELLYALKCPKLLIQPIVENAISHGLEKKVDGGIVTIEIEEFKSKIEIWVKDNGAGMTEEKLEQVSRRLHHDTYTPENRRNKGIALHNVSRRIKLLCGDQYGIYVFSIRDIGTDIRIDLPIIKDSE